MNPTVSIITPSYNAGRFIGKAIQSVLAQTFADWEMIIVDDCSTDDSLKIISSFDDPRIKSASLDGNSGAGIARNTALQIASGRYIAFLDADDFWKPEKLEKQLKFMQSQKIPFTFSYYDCVDESENSLNRIVKAPKTLTYRQLFFCNFVGNLTGIYDSAEFGKIQINSVRKRQDWILWLTIVKRIKKAPVLPEVLASYRIRKDSISASKKSLLRHNYRIYRDFHQLSPLASLACMIGFLFTQLIIKPRYISRK